MDEELERNFDFHPVIDFSQCHVVGGVEDQIEDRRIVGRRSGDDDGIISLAKVCVV